MSNIRVDIAEKGPDLGHAEGKEPAFDQMLLVADIGDLVDRPGLIVCDQKRAIRRNDDVGRPAQDLVAIQEPGQEYFLRGVGAVRIDAHALDPIADLLVPIP